MSDRQQGVLKTYDPIKGYGFITRTNGKDVFVLYRDFENQGFETNAIAGAILEFDIERVDKGLQARNVKIIS